MYGAPYPPYHPPAPQAPPIGYGPPTSFPTPPPGSFSSSHPPPGFPHNTYPPNNAPQPGFTDPSSQAPPHSSAPSSQPPPALSQSPPAVAPPAHMPFQHLPPPPGFPLIHPPPHLAHPVLPQPHPHQFPHHHPPPGSYFPPNRHAGLGSHPQPHKINSIVSPPLSHPSTPNHNHLAPGAAPALPSRPAPTEIYSLFVGSIAEGVDDAWLERLLGCAGHLVSLRRIRDPNGRPKPFGFAEYGDPESVLRCLKVIHGRSLPIDGGKAGEKALMIKPDDKTKARLDAYEANRIKTDQDAELDTQAVERLEGLISQMKDPDILAATAADQNAASNNNSHSKKNSAAHLQDLAPEDLPEESRGTITREIQFFRERAISKRGEAEKAAKERERSHRDSGSGSPAGPRGNGKAGYGSSNSTPMGPRGNTAASGAGSTSTHDPQSSNRPVSFVRAGQMAAAKQNAGGAPSSATDPTAPLTDQEEEKMREERRKRMNHLEFKDRERRWETRERNRAQTNQREQQREKAIKEEEARLRNQTKTRLAHWDDEVEMERGKELFYSNRQKWRSMRRAFRQREEKSDRIDEELENEELEAIQKESEEFLNKQAEMIAKMQDENRKAGLLQLDEGGKPIQLSFGVGLVANNQNGSGKPGGAGGGALGIQPITLKKESKAVSGLLGNGDDDDDGFKRKRALIPLTYDDDDHNNNNNQTIDNPAATKINIRFGSKPNHSTTKQSSGTTPAMSEEKKKIKIKEIVASVPTDKEDLWKVTMNWDYLSESIIDQKLQPFANKKIIDYLGLQEDELVIAIIDHIRAKKDAQGLVDELEPVLAEEAEEFVLKFWRMLVFELRAAEAGITSTPVAQ